MVVSARGTQRFAWSDILEVSWVRGTSFVGSGPGLRATGGQYDEPGSNREAARSLAEAAASHGIPFTPDLQRVVNRGERRPQL